MLSDVETELIFTELLLLSFEATKVSDCSYYTGKKFPSTVALNKLYYFMPYMKRKGIRDLYLIKIARVGTKKEVHSECDDNDLRLVFEIKFVKQLFDDYKPHRLKIWETFTDTTLGELME